MSFATPFTFIFKPGDAGKRPVLLLHGTGGNEHDLVGLAETAAPGRAILSPRGRVSENGMPRFFRRFAEGVFDEDDVRLRADELATFVSEACKTYDIKSPIALGYSNGANIAAALLLQQPAALSGAVLLRAMAPFKILPRAGFARTPVLLISGQSDRMIPLAEAERLAVALRDGGALLTHEILPASHGLTQADLVHITRFFATAE